MIVSAFFAIIVLAVTLGVLFWAARSWGIDAAFQHASWIMIVIWVVQVVQLKRFLEAFGAGAFMIPVVTAGVSTVLGIVGATLVLSRAPEDQTRRKLIVATFVVLAPIFLLCAYVACTFIDAVMIP